MTVKGLLILLRMPPPNLMGTWSSTATHQHLKTRRSWPIFYYESSWNALLEISPTWRSTPVRAQYTFHRTWYISSGTITTTLTIYLNRENQFHPSDIWFFTRVVLFLLSHHCWQQFLAQSVENLYLGLCAKMTSSLFKKVMIEQAELDHSQQCQLHEHSPELQAMVRLLNNMSNITVKKKLIAAKLLNSISGLQI